ncbi:MAG: hypothetical protein R3F03_13295 [Opitutaceae bacterium]
MATPTTSVDREKLRAYLLGALEAKLPEIRQHARPDGRMGTDPWICRDQHDILTLALLYRTAGSSVYRDPAVLELIAKGGAYLTTMQDEKGMWRFDKKDGSYWGQIFMPWTYVRWIITYGLIRDELPAAERAAWEKGLQLGYAGIAATELSSLSNIYPGPLTGQPPLAPGEVRPWLHNIPAHHATGLFLAGQYFNRPDWQDQARAFMQLLIAEQNEHGWWTEHRGPVVLYNRVYIEALGIYYAASGDDSVLAALERGNRFHLNYLYPNGAMIETVDERNPYPVLKVETAADGATTYRPPNINIHPGLYFTDEGRALLAHQLPLIAAQDPAGLEAAEFLLLKLPADGALTYRSAPEKRFRMGSEALIAREDPWIVSLSAYCCERTPNRFIQDRQNLISIYHRDAGLIIGGGNTKLQPFWSTLTVGDPALVSPVGATRETNLAPEVDVAYTPEASSIAEPEPQRWVQRIAAAGAEIEWSFTVISAAQLRLALRLIKAAPDGRAVASHLTFIPYLGTTAKLSDGTEHKLTAEAWSATGLDTLAHHQWQLSLPEAATVRWPVLPHNPYTNDGHADFPEGRLVVSLPLDAAQPQHELTLTIAG